MTALLLAYGADPAAKDSYDLTPLTFSILGQDDPEASASPLGNFNETMHLLREAVDP